ncbi:MAG: hypothetical protein HRJ53_27925 [Acidobacteria bacterium Pan2503]|uniref:Uncharacterized protein n=1 Tax=Candidatus Acidiferrum panamense TaxID=2741543 RepID=A0A7V8NWK4_9BACT|nr:hypothetical protein [Candidatus Acidoferrum panamensis]
MYVPLGVSFPPLWLVAAQPPGKMSNAHVLKTNPGTNLWRLDLRRVAPSPTIPPSGNNRPGYGPAIPIIGAS